MILADRIIKRNNMTLIIRSGTVAKLLGDQVQAALKEVGDLYLRAAIENVSLTDHTLAELAELGHPYRRGKGGIAAAVHDDDRLVHAQSMNLFESLKMSPVQESSNGIFGIYLMSNVPYLNALLYGTPTMRPRRFHVKAYEDVKKVLWEPVVDRLVKVDYKILL